MKVKAPRGTNDILPGDVEKWQFVEGKFREICSFYGYQEIRTPIFEHTELFTRGIGGSTDIVEKEMYTFLDKKNRSLTLRPEWTADVMRSIIEHNLPLTPPLKLFYIGPIFRYERPQKGRYRQSHQVGVEIIGAKSPLVDVEVIEFIVSFYKSLGLLNLSVSLNSIGCADCRKDLKDFIKNFFMKDLSSFCNNCQRRFDRNPFRVMDCKNKTCNELIKTFPGLLKVICENCKLHFDTIITFLDKLQIPYKIDNTLVRGLDYYTKTVFEVVSRSLGSQNSLCGGGRYDELMEILGGKPSPGIGFAAGIERAIIVLEEEGISFPDLQRISMQILPLGENALEYAFKIATDLRRESFISVDLNLSNKSLKAQLKHAHKKGALFTLILGDREIENREFILRDMRSGEQLTVAEDMIVNTLKSKFKK